MEDKNLQRRIAAEIAVLEEIERDPEFMFALLSVAIKGLENYRKEITKKNSYINMIVRNLKPEYYAELKKYVIPEIFEVLGLQDAIRVVESSETRAQ